MNKESAKPAKGLALSLEILPDLDGLRARWPASSQIRRYLDTDKDGKADQFAVILDSFGIHFRTSFVLPNYTVSKRLLMPEGLIEGFSENQVADLFSYMISLK